MSETCSVGLLLDWGAKRQLGLSGHDKLDDEVIVKWRMLRTRTVHSTAMWSQPASGGGIWSPFGGRLDSAGERIMPAVVADLP
jgi:hypothetical protein